MDWDALFGLVNIVALGGWLLLAVAPRKPLVLSAVMYAGVGLLCLVYAIAFALLVAGAVDPVRVGGGAASMADYSIAGIRTLFASDGGIVVGWTHYLAFDLFVGLWIARDADAKGFGRIAQLPILFVTLLAGPIGLLIWLGLRERAARRDAGSNGRVR